MEKWVMEGMIEAAPILASLEIAKTVAFYTEKPGFRKAGWIDANYAILMTDGNLLRIGDHL